VQGKEIPDVVSALDRNLVRGLTGSPPGWTGISREPQEVLKPSAFKIHPTILTSVNAR
jgi:hypothetical protein